MVNMENNNKKIRLNIPPIDPNEVFSACCNSKNGIKFERGISCKKLDKIFANHSPDVHLEFKGKANWTPLMFACYFEFTDGVKKLLEIGADPNVVGLDTKSPLAVAAVKGNLNICKLLIEAGANLNYVDKWGKTALFECAEPLNSEKTVSSAMIEYMIEAGVDLEHKNNEGQNVLDYMQHTSGGKNNHSYNVIHKAMLKQVIFNAKQNPFEEEEDLAVADHGFKL